MKYQQNINNFRQPDQPKMNKEHQTNLFNFDEEVQPFSWGDYNKSQTSEKRLFIKLLGELSNTLDPYYREKVFCMCLKVYLNTSARRVMSDIAIAKQAGYIPQLRHFNTILNYFNNSALRPVLEHLIELSAFPLAQLERKFAVDSSGIGAHQYEPWKSIRDRKELHRKYKKFHCIYGVLSNVIVSCRVTKGTAGDSPRFQELLHSTARNFSIEEVSADLAYSSRQNVQAVSDVGGIAYIPFKKNATGRAGGHKIWRQMYHYFKNHQEEFMKHYHLRSNAETGFFMVKQKFGEFVKCRNDVAQENEIYCKVLCHNICVLIQEMFLSKVEVNFLEASQRFVAQE